MKKFNRKKVDGITSTEDSSSAKKGGKPSVTKVIKQALQDKAIDYIKSGNIEALEKMTEDGSEEIRFLNRFHTKSGKTALCVAAEEGRFASMELLLKAKPNVNLVDKTGMTAFLYAAKQGELNILEMLHDAEADLHVKSESKLENALILASAGNHMQCVELLDTYGLAIDEKNKLEETALSIALKFEYYDICTFLVSRLADINVVGKNGNTPLLRTAFDGHEKTATFLLQNGGDVNWKNMNGETALMVASRHGYGNLVKLFLDSGADVDAVDDSKRNALMMVCMVGKYDIIDLLVERGIDVNSVDLWGYSALMYLCNRPTANFSEPQMQQHITAIEMLVGRGAFIDSMDRNFNTALMHCCAKGNMDIAMVLLNLGADATFRSIDDVAVSDLISSEGNREIFVAAVHAIGHVPAHAMVRGDDGSSSGGVRQKPGWINELNSRAKRKVVPV